MAIDAIHVHTGIHVYLQEFHVPVYMYCMVLIDIRQGPILLTTR